MLFRKMAAISGIALALSLPAAEPAHAIDDLSARLEPIREEFALPALVAAVVREGRIVAAGAVGVRAVGFDKLATVDDKIHIGSDGKAMTALVAAMLVEEGRLRWDSTVGEVLGHRVADMNPALAGVTLEQMLSHSSGIPRDTPEMMDIYFNVDAFDYTPRQLRLRALEAWKQNAPKVPEGSPFQYSNFGYLIVGAMIEEVLDLDWERIIVEKVYEPLGLRTAGLGATASPGRIDALVGHVPLPDGGAEARPWGNSADMPQVLAPAGTVHMSILDFARWAGWVAGKGSRPPFLVAPETLAYLMTEKVRTPTRPNPPPGTPAEGAYALGWSIEKFGWADRELVTHNGSNGMNLAKILVDTDRDLAVVVVTNIGGRNADLGAGRVLATIYPAY